MIGHPGGAPAARSLSSPPAPKPATAPAPAPAPAAPAPEPTRATEPKPSPFFAPPLLSHDLFASAPLSARKKPVAPSAPAPLAAPAPSRPVVASRPAAVPPKTKTFEAIKLPAAAKVTPPAKASPTASLPREIVAPILNRAIAHAQVGINGSFGGDDEPLGKAEFMKAVTAHMSVRKRLPFAIRGTLAERPTSRAEARVPDGALQPIPRTVLGADGG